MGINPKYYQSHVLGLTRAGTNTIEFFGDYNCPFACKLFKKVEDELVPEMKARGLLSKYQLTFVNVVQPWHGFQSSALHESALAVARLAPEKFWPASRCLYDNIELFYDSEIYDLTKRELVQKIVKLLSESVDVPYADILALVETSQPKPNGDPNNVGSIISKDLKYLTRYGRTIGVHITPSIVVNGIYLPAIESSTSVDDIIKILELQTL